ncbi:unnamed protein product [Adineta steineri]|uniref:Uncharacterized protein n=1 Tax=Adineta steineri TaxID=433720 RepID=A0A818VR30_9BILA|nr:unnamed protein product [Adineta steineri]CAF0718926.1 unnamed protein product [Adineta steineri]CAF3485220.1 unnamed protein product [Adineta steineri]CAF3714713.1 unnamed protein product [Adineta steineri]
MTYRSTLSRWFQNRFPKPPPFRIDFYRCTSCGVQSFDGVYFSACPQCRGILPDIVRNVRYEYFCTSCSRQRNVCRCDYPSPFVSLIRLPTPPSPQCQCCCSCTCCNCSDCDSADRWELSPCRECCSSNCSCSSYCSQCNCSCSPQSF